jgi:hypothetical protein
VRDLCKLYHQATEWHEQGIHLISTDEKTGMQALDPLHPNGHVIGLDTPSHESHI